MSLYKPIAARVVAGVCLAGEVNVFNLVRAGDELNASAGIHPSLHGFEHRFLLVLREFRNVVGNNSIRPRQRLLRVCRNVSWIGIRLGQSEYSET